VSDADLVTSEVMQLMQGLAPLTGGGTVILTQWKTKPANSDFSCPPPPKAKGR
jgi:hypothetical protein